MLGSAVALISKIHQHLLLKRRVGKGFDLFELRFIIFIRDVQLAFDQRQRLLGKKLGRKCPALCLIVAFFLQLIDRRQMFFSVCPDIFALTIGLNVRPERIVRVISDLLEDLLLRCSGFLIRVEHNVLALRDVVGIDRHALQIMRSVHHDADLRVMRIAKIQIGDTGPDLDHAVLLVTTLIAVVDIHSIRADAGRTFPLGPGRAAVVGMVLPDLLDHSRMIVKLPMLNTGAGKNDHVRLIAARIGRVLKPHAIMAVALHLQDERCFLQRARRDAHAELHTLADINGLLVLQLFSKNVRGPIGFIKLQLLVLIAENRPDRGFILSCHACNLRRRISIRLQRLYMRILMLFSFMERTALKEAHIRRRKLKLIHDLLLGLTLFPHLLHAAEPVSAVLVRAIAGPPRITSGTSRHSVMRKSLRFIADPII